MSPIPDSDPQHQTAAFEIAVEADVDLGVTSRILDLLSAQNHLPSRLNLFRRGSVMTVTMSLPAGGAPHQRLLAKMQQIPGVRSASAATATP